MQRNLWKIKSCFLGLPVFLPQCPVMPSAGSSSVSCQAELPTASGRCSQCQVTVQPRHRRQGPGTAVGDCPAACPGAGESLGSCLSQRCQLGMLPGGVNWLCQAVSGTSEPSGGQGGLAFCPLAQC